MKMISTMLAAASILIAGSVPSIAGDPVKDEQYVEAVEYVRVCDTYGKGYFYIPGTEMCLGLGGDVRARFGKIDIENNITNTRQEETVTQWRGRLHAKLRAQTDKGELNAEIRVAGEANNSVATGAIDRGYIEYAGFSVGFRESQQRRALWQGIDQDYLTNDRRPFTFADGAVGFHNAWHAEYKFTIPEFDALAIVIGGQNANGVSSSTSVIDPYLTITYTDPNDLFVVGANVVYAIGSGTVDNTIVATGFATIDLTEQLFLSGFYTAEVGDGPTAYVDGDNQYAVLLGWDINDNWNAYLGYQANGGTGASGEEQVASVSATYQPDLDKRFYIIPQLDWGFGDTEGFNATATVLLEF